MPDAEIRDDKKTTFTLFRTDSRGWLMEVPPKNANDARQVLQSDNYRIFVNKLNFLFDEVDTTTMLAAVMQELETIVYLLAKSNSNLRYTLFAHKNFQPILAEAEACALRRIERRSFT